MLNLRVCYTEQPAEVLYMPLPEGGADVWLRKNPDEVPDAPDVENAEPTTHWEADEAYIRFESDPPTEKAIKADFATWYDTAAAWQPEQITPPIAETLDDRVNLLENENKALHDQLDTVMDVVDFILMEV